MCHKVLRCSTGSSRPRLSLAVGDIIKSKRLKMPHPAVAVKKVELYNAVVVPDELKVYVRRNDGMQQLFRFGRNAGCTSLNSRELEPIAYRKSFGLVLCELRYRAFYEDRFHWPPGLFKGLVLCKKFVKV